MSNEALPILALTANAYADDVAACLAAGMQAHVAKPVQLADLGAAIRRWTRADAPPPETVAPPVTKLAIPPGLRARCESCKAELLACAGRIVETSSFDDAAIEELRGMLHKLAGSAGMFEEAELGIKAADLRTRSNSARGRSVRHGSARLSRRSPWSPDRHPRPLRESAFAGRLPEAFAQASCIADISIQAGSKTFPSGSAKVRTYRKPMS